MKRALLAHTRCLPHDEHRQDPDWQDGDAWRDLHTPSRGPDEQRMQTGEEPAPDWIPL
jgi:hypothetical protein